MQQVFFLIDDATISLAFGIKIRQMYPSRSLGEQTYYLLDQPSLTYAYLLVLFILREDLFYIEIFFCSIQFWSLRKKLRNIFFGLSEG